VTTVETLPQGDVRLLAADTAQRLLVAEIPARLAYVAGDGTPRVVPINFHWTGDEVVMAGFAPSSKAKAIRANPNVAITIDTASAPPEVLMIRGLAEITEMAGLVPEYELAYRRGIPDEVADPYMAELRERKPPMERIAVRPTWVGLLDFKTRFPSRMPEWTR
jgi:hypothetical protein